MAMSDPVGDMLTRIRNGLKAQKDIIECPSSNLRAGILSVLKENGYIRNFEVVAGQHGQKVAKIELKYFQGMPAIKKMKRVSKPGRRVYSNINDLQTVHNGLGVAIITTPQGVMTDHQARAAHVGGEVLCEVF